MCKLPVGYVVSNKKPNASVDSIYSQDIEDFYVVENKKQLGHAYSVLQERINNFHIASGVEIVKPKSVYIEPDVDISEGVVIYANNTIKGHTTIGSGTILKENNVIEDSVIGSNCCMAGSNITKSHLCDEVYVASFCELIGAVVSDNSTIGTHSCIYGKKIKKGTKIEPNTILGENKC